MILTVPAMAAMLCACCRYGEMSELNVWGGDVRRIAVDEYVDRMKAGWIGQMAGVGWGGPTEFKYKGSIILENEMPHWQPEAVNQFNQDDLYVEMTFLRTLEVYGLEASTRQAGIDFANSGYELWHANLAARENLRNGIAPPDSGHPQFNVHADDIDYQIESDYSGLIAPGLPNVPIQLGEKFGRLMNYGDGLYGGQFIGAMYSAAFFETDMEKIVRAGLECIPKASQYHECISDVLKWHKKYPDDWVKTWLLIKEKYHDNPDYRRFSCDQGSFNIDAKINGAYVVTGLLYGKGDPDATITIAMRCGQDSDCNPSSAGGILFTTIGYRNLPDKFKSALNPEGKFSHTPYNFPTLVKVCEKLARKAVIGAGGRIETDSEGKKEVFVIPMHKPQPSVLEQCWQPRPISNSRFTEQELGQITALIGEDLSSAIAKFAPGWKVSRCGHDMESSFVVSATEKEPGLHAEERGRKNILVTYPLNDRTGCIISRRVALPAPPRGSAETSAGRKKSTLRLTVGHDPRGDWDLIVRANRKELLRKTVGPETTQFGWMTVDVDLSEYAGKTVELELINQPTAWHYETALWAEISLLTR